MTRPAPRQSTRFAVSRVSVVIVSPQASGRRPAAAMVAGAAPRSVAMVSTIAQPVQCSPMWIGTDRTAPRVPPPRPAFVSPRWTSRSPVGAPLEQLAVVALEERRHRVDVARGQGAGFLDGGDRCGRGPDHQPTHVAGAGVAEAVRRTWRDDDGASRARMDLLVAELELQVALEYVEDLGVAAVQVQERHAGPGRERRVEHAEAEFGLLADLDLQLAVEDAQKPAFAGTDMEAADVTYRFGVTHLHSVTSVRVDGTCQSARLHRSPVRAEACNARTNPRGRQDAVPRARVRGAVLGEGGEEASVVERPPGLSSRSRVGRCVQGGHVEVDAVVVDEAVVAPLPDRDDGDGDAVAVEAVVGDARLHDGGVLDVPGVGDPVSQSLDGR